MAHPHLPERDAWGSPREVLWAFLLLGLRAFGGPVAHLGYFREEFVVRRRWLSDAAYAELVTLCQLLPGPASSQVGFALGLRRAGPLGAAAAWIGFTLPSALLMLGAAAIAPQLTGGVGSALVHALQLVAAAVVAQAVWGMGRNLLKTPVQLLLAVAAATLTLLLGGAVGTVAAVLAGGLVGGLLPGASPAAEPTMSTNGHGGLSRALPWAAAFLLLLAALPLLRLATGDPALALADGFYRSGALVFGGGHVVLPLLEGELVRPGLVSEGDFLAVYGAAQAVPGPLFSVGAGLGALARPGPGGVAGAALGLLALFLPGLLLLLATLPVWDRLEALPRATGAIAGANAAVVGVLAAALYDPVLTTAIRSPADALIAAAGALALIVLRLPSLAVLAAVLAASLAVALGPALLSGRS